MVLVVVATGVLNEQKIDNLNMDTIMLYVGVSVLGTALGGTGAAELMGSAPGLAPGQHHQRLYHWRTFYIVAWLMTSFLYNRAVTTVLYPLAIMTCSDHECRSHRPHHPSNIASMSSLVTPMATGVVPLAMTAGGYNLKTIFKAGMVPAVVRGGQRVGDHDHVPYLNRLLQPGVKYSPHGIPCGNFLVCQKT